MPSSLLYFVVGISTLWILVCAALLRLRIRRSRRQLSLPVRQNGKAIQYSSSERVSNVLDSWSWFKGQGQLQVGWLWLILSWNAGSPSELKNDTTAVMITRRSDPARRKPLITDNILKVFYTIGTLVILLAFLAVPVHLLLNLYHTFSHRTGASVVAVNGESQANQALTGLLIPGLTIPPRDGLTLFLAGFVAIAWHEAGHAITAILCVIIELFPLTFGNQYTDMAFCNK